jgi:hypothetical protein
MNVAVLTHGSPLVLDLGCALAIGLNLSSLPQDTPSLKSKCMPLCSPEPVRPAGPLRLAVSCHLATTSVVLLTQLQE